MKNAMNNAWLFKNGFYFSKSLLHSNEFLNAPKFFSSNVGIIKVIASVDLNL